MTNAEDTLRRMTPPPPAELRSRVLAEMFGELQSQRSRHVDRYLVLLAAAAIAAALIFAAWTRHDRAERIARALGPRPVPTSVVEVVLAVEPKADSDRARQLTRRLMPVAGRQSSTRLHVRRYRQLLDVINSRG